MQGPSRNCVHALEDQNKIAQAPLPSRDDQLKRLQEEEFDVLVIGAGATGCGVALDAQSRGQLTYTSEG